MQSDTLSEAAVALLRRHAEHDGVPLTDENREAHRELAAAGLMVVGHDFLAGREAFYRLTKIGWKLADVLERSDHHQAPDERTWTVTEDRPEGSIVQNCIREAMKRVNGFWLG